MKLPVRLRSAAENDLAEHARFLQESSVELAIRFLDASDATIALLSQTPGIGGVCSFANARLDGIRVWPISGFRNHLIFYRILAEEIEVVRVLHGARDLSSIFGDGK